MNTSTTNTKKHLKVLEKELKVLQEKLVVAHKFEGKDAYIDVRVKKNQAHAEKIKRKDKTDAVTGKFYMKTNNCPHFSKIYLYNKQFSPLLCIVAQRIMREYKYLCI